MRRLIVAILLCATTVFGATTQPRETQISGKGTGVDTALAINVGSTGAFIANGGILGTPSSGTLTNCTGLPVAGITASTSTALGVGSIELGHATDTTIARVSAGVASIEGVNILTTTAIDDTAYGVGWDTDTTHAPSKNAVYDIINGISGASISDAAFGFSWDSVTTVAPSKNSVYDWGHTFDTDDDGKVNVLDLSTAELVKTNTSGVVSNAAAGTDYLAPSAIDNTAYNATTWNGDTTHAPSKDAVRDKIETMGGGGTIASTSNMLKGDGAGNASASDITTASTTYTLDKSSNATETFSVSNTTNGTASRAAFSATSNVASLSFQATATLFTPIGLYAGKDTALVGNADRLIIGTDASTHPIIFTTDGGLTAVGRILNGLILGTSSTDPGLGVARLTSIELGHDTDTTVTRASAGVMAVEGVNVLLNGGALGTPASGTLTNCTFPTLNQNTSGSAATLTTARNLWGQSFNGSAAVAGAIELGTSGTTDTTLDRSSAGHASIEGSVIGLASDTLSFFTASTSNAIGVGSIELGHATDTTLSRNAAGVLQVESVVVPTISSTNTLTNKRITKRVLDVNVPSSPVTPDSDSYDGIIYRAIGAALTLNAPSGTPTSMQPFMFRFKDDGTGRGLTWTTGSNGFRAIVVAFPTTTVANKTTYVLCIWNGTDSRWDSLATGTEP